MSGFIKQFQFGCPNRFILIGIFTVVIIFAFITVITVVTVVSVFAVVVTVVSVFAVVPTVVVWQIGGQVQCHRGGVFSCVRPLCGHVSDAGVNRANCSVAMQSTSSEQ